MTVRDASRPLTGPSKTSAWSEPEIKLGHRPIPTDTTYYYERNVWRGQKAVTVDLQGGRSGVRTYEDGYDLVVLAAEILQGATYLGVDLGLLSETLRRLEETKPAETEGEPA